MCGQETHVRPSPKAQREAARAGSRQVMRRVSYGFARSAVAALPVVVLAFDTVSFVVFGVEAAVPVSVAAVMVVVVALPLLSIIADELLEPLPPNTGDARPVVHCSEYSMPPTVATAATVAGSLSNTNDPPVVLLLPLLLVAGTATSVLSSRVPRVAASLC